MRRPIFATIVATLLLVGCERDMRDMYDQNKPHPDAQSARYGDGRDARSPVAGTVANTSGVMAAASSGRAAGTATALTPRQQLERGRERYDIYCAPCHSPTGDGDGMVVRRGFPKPQSFHTPAQRSLSDTAIEQAIGNGIGAMRPMGTRVDSDDRKLIIAYLRALQLSQNAILDDVPDSERKALYRGAP